MNEAVGVALKVGAIVVLTLITVVAWKATKK